MLTIRAVFRYNTASFDKKKERNEKIRSSTHRSSRMIYTFRDLP